MAIYALGKHTPKIDPTAFVHPDATVIGNVTIGAESSVWPRAVLRGDYGPIIIGARTNIQDGSVIHATHEMPTVIGDDCVIGHLVHMECCTVESGSLIGSGSIVLHRALIRSGALVAAAALVPNGMEVPSGAMALGVPATLRHNAVRPEMISLNAASYVANAKYHASELRRID
ncbi:MAG: gamma carbonic anhydrase family protein, partial [Acidimicrobiia bacterium]|nr:gamma carbonic anhydrase family protein [Acidimicrobiia bacterium]MBJ7382772.1 gamma carbonic anhydrase family protein [Acidimicrobiia bacterium]